jgi:hypothetical protein
MQDTDPPDFSTLETSNLSLAALSSGNHLKILNLRNTWGTSPTKMARRTVWRPKAFKNSFQDVQQQPRVKPLNKSVEAFYSSQELQGGVPPATTLDTTYNAFPLTEPKSTRVLRILPPELQDGDNITCQLEVISLDDNPPPEFSALSYVWGSPSETRCITVNNKLFVVRKNLWTFLDHMRKQGVSGPIWIDSISINQTCIPERNHQVAVMGDIFKMATKVIAWIGPESTIISSYWGRLNRPGNGTLKMVKFIQAPIFDSIRLMLEELSLPLNFGAVTKVAENLRICILLLESVDHLFSA